VPIIPGESVSRCSIRVTNRSIIDTVGCNLLMYANPVIHVLLCYDIVWFHMALWIWNLQLV